jgi:chromate transporter
VSETLRASAGSEAEERESVPKLSQLQIFLRFLRFGFLAWGGPVAQIAMIRHELVETEHWVSNKRFNRLLAVYQVLPGPEAHELCVFLGMLPGGRLGGFFAGLGFMLPGFVLMFALSWLYLTVDISGSFLSAIFFGLQPAVIALIVRAVDRIGRHILVDRWLWAIAIISAVATLFGTQFWITLPLAGLVYLFVVREQRVPAVVFAACFLAIVGYFVINAGFSPEFGAQAEAATSATGQTVQPSLIELFFSGLKAGLLTFGGAYTVIPFLRNDAVGSSWMSDAEFLNGLALSGILPAPLIIFSTFVGYYGGGPLGAIAMTVGIFLPAFSFSLFFHDHLEKLVDNKSLHAFLEGVSAGVVGLIAATTVELAIVTLRNVPGVLPALIIFAVSLVALYLSKAKTTVLFVVLAAAAASFLLY